MSAAFAKIGAAGTLGQGDSRICIAVLDGPADLTHPCFHGAYLRSLRLFAEATRSDVAERHGTHVASIIFGQPEGPVAGIAPACRGLLLPIFSAAASGDGLACSQLDLARAILLAIENGAHVINISGGELTPSGEPEPMLAGAIRACVRHNVLIVASAGNDGCECLHVPAASPSVLAVGAMDARGEPMTLSNWGGAYVTNGILAPGQDIRGAVPGGGAAVRSGTSFAAPVVSGVVGLLASLQIKLGKPLDPYAIRSAILNGAVPCLEGTSQDCRRFLAGRLSVSGAIKYLLGRDNIVSEVPSVSASGFSELALADAGGPPSNEEATVRPASTPEPDARVMLSEALKTPASSFRVPSTLPGPSEPGKGGSSPSPRSSSKIALSECSCGSGAECTCGAAAGAKAALKPLLVYALGKLGVDFSSDARRDSFAQAMSPNANNPHLPDHLLGHLTAHPYDGAMVTWTLNLDATPIYAIQPMGPFAETAYQRLQEFLQAQVHEGAELVSIPGVVAGGARLHSGQVVPVIVPAIRGMFSWSAKALVEHVLGPRPEGQDGRASYDTQSAGLTDFLNRVYYDLRNLGLTAEERAINFCATNAVQIADVVRSATQQGLDLETLTAKKSPICRPDSDCYDIELSFFNPNNTIMANRVFRFTVDVSDVIPVSVGAVRSWTRRA